MEALAERFRPADVERAARELWAGRGLPPPDGVLGRTTAPVVRQFEGSLVAGDDPNLVAFRAVAADVDARYLCLAGRRAAGTLRQEGGPDDLTLTLLRALSVWTGGTGGSPVDSGERRTGSDAILGRMAERGLVVTRETPLLVCPSCAQARSPERIVYRHEEGDTFLVRFSVAGADGPLHALVWVDAPWRLLGASALLVNPRLPYVVAKYRRRATEEKILTSKSSLARLVEQLPGSEVEVLEEGRGARWQGTTYEYPLRHEFPMGGELVPPAGTIVGVPDVSDSGTGLVPLVPGHGGTDAQIADRLGITGWPLVTSRGQLDFNLAHKYSGLDIPTANEFVARDLIEAGAVFARLRVRRGVPHCAVCGTPMVWASGRAWCLEPARLPPERRDAYRRLLPRDPPVGQVYVTSWPVSEPQTTPAGAPSVTLLECPRCERLDGVGGPPTCPCGQRRNPVSRRLLPSFSAALAEWAGADPFPAGDSVWLYLNERRRAPALVHQLAVMSGVVGAPNDVGLTLLPGVPGGTLSALAEAHGADAVRAALVRGERRERAGPHFEDRCRQEARRLERWWNLAREVLERTDPSLLPSFAQPLTGCLGELEREDRAILARWERVRLGALADYDHQAPEAALRRLARFLDNDLAAYLARVRPRLAKAGVPPTRQAALRTLHHLLRGGAVTLAPVVPHVAEAVHGAFVPGRTSLFERTFDPLDSTLLDERAVAAWDRWNSVVGAVERFRREVSLPTATPISRVVAVAGTDELAADLRADAETLQRLLNVGRFEAYGPGTPWNGRQRTLSPIVSEIQKAYPREASQIVHLLRGMPRRHRAEPDEPDELSVVVHGLPKQILPGMVEYVDGLPEGFQVLPWPRGELYAELPTHHAVPDRVLPPISPDALRVVGSLDRELRRLPAPNGAVHGPVVVATSDPVASELRSASRAVATFLRVAELRVVPPSAEFPSANCLFGRSRTGVYWWAHLPDRPPVVRRRKLRARRPEARHRPPEEADGGAPCAVDYASGEEVARQQQIRNLAQELDGLLGAPLLGPTKVAGAWSAGFHAVDDFGRARFEQIEALPGFGRPVATALAQKMGRPVPARTALRPTVPRSLGNSVQPEEGSPRTASSQPPGAAAQDQPHPARSGSPRAPTRSGKDRVPPASLTEEGSVAEHRVEPPTPSKEQPRNQGLSVGSNPLAPILEGPPPAPWDARSPSPPVRQAPQEDGRRGSISIAEMPPPDTIFVPEAHAPRGESENLAQACGAYGPGSGDEIDVSSGGGRRSDAAEVAEAGSESPAVELREAPYETSTRGTVSRPTLPDDGPLQGPSVPFPERLGPLPSRDSSDLLGGVATHESTVTDRPEEVVVTAEVSDSETANEGLPPLPDSHATVVGSESEPEVVPIPSESDAPSLAPEANSRFSDPPGAPEPLGPGVDTFPRMASIATSLDGAVNSSPSGGPLLSPGPAGPGADLPESPSLQPEVGEPLPDEGAVPAEDPFPTGPLGLGGLVTCEQGGSSAQATVAELATEFSVESRPVPTPSGGLTLTVGPSYLPPFSRFLEATAAGHRGICVVRESPDRLRAHIGPRPVEVYWLTNLGRGLTLRPNDLDGYTTFLRQSLEQDRVTAFFLEGVEYLTRLHGAERVVEHLAALHLAAQARDARVWVYVHPDLMPAADLALFEAAFGSDPGSLD
jgi:hypothetical protein